MDLVGNRERTSTMTLWGRSSLEKLDTADLGAKRAQIECQEIDDNPAGDLSLNLHRRVEELGFESCKGFSQGIFEIGDGCINEDINGEKDNGFYTMEAPDSDSATEISGERIGLTQVGRGTGTQGIRKIMTATQTSSERMGLEGREEELGYLEDVLKAQQEIVVENTEKCSSPLKSPRTRRNSTQTLGALVEFQSNEDNNLLKLLER
ncbi:hypothetical protein Ancab_017849 [Ancistrocladus abbreviatus]